MKPTTIFAAFILSGGLFMILGAYLHERTAKFLERSTEVAGVVVAMERNGDGAHSPVVEYVDHLGETRTLYSRVSSNPPRYFEGEQVTVVYDPADPKYPVRAAIKAPLDLWGATGFFYIFGAAWVLIAGLAWYVHSKGGVIVFGSKGDVDPYTD